LKSPGPFGKLRIRNVTRSQHKLQKGKSPAKTKASYPYFRNIARLRSMSRPVISSDPSESFFKWYKSGNAHQVLDLRACRNAWANPRPDKDDDTPAIGWLQCGRNDRSASGG